MSDIILKAENISKQYRLGLVGLGTLGHDFNRFWHKIRGKEDPYLKIGSVNDRSAKASSEYVWALQDINFEVKRGEVLGIIGKNGAGKSTLLKLLSRVTAPTTGSFKTRGRIASLLEVGTGMHPELTGRENIFLNGAILGMTKTEIANKIDEIISFSGCEMYIDTPVKRYSSGMRVRLGFAVAAFLEPDILVVDEVLAVGDAEFQKKAIGKMKDVSSQGGRTVLFVSHNMAAVKNLCTRAIVLENGKLVFSGSTSEGVDYYLNIGGSENSNLAGREDRQGSGNLKFTDINIYNSKGTNTIDIFTGESVKIRLDYELYNPDEIKKFLMSLVVFDQMETICASFISDELPLDFKPKDGYIELTVNSFNIRPGNYYMSIYSFDEHFRNESYIDQIDNVIRFTINTKKHDPSGNFIRPGSSSFLIGNYEQKFD